MSPGFLGTSVGRSRVRRAGESAYGLLLLARAALMGAVAAVLLMAGVWVSLDGTRQAVADRGAVRGTMTVAECDGGTCTGPFAPEGGGGGARAEVAVEAPVSYEAGERLPVALWPGREGSDGSGRAGGAEAVRTGTAGVLYAWLPLAGALVLASPVIAGGLGMRRTAWGAGLSGLALMGAAFALL
ncbi:hypothetical protein [Streptomyces radiopugnans]|uniref:Uncharacterized protein n=1 Tax=Streptomyces radiopugnans TaxID=403935 RepID=A0A1H9H387_9ACTN|nr:hypothetical protein [Streptomyces radiopugnans]SEQ56782.1 hypothetical protein SAMN05216481_11081 [Streptomyces radiopugnans]